MAKGGGSMDCGIVGVSVLMYVKKFDNNNQRRRNNWTDGLQSVKCTHLQLEK